ncbi:ATP-binding protein [Pseudarcicella hirudinis]|uniref:ATP-binding protein n=1 Tax=Pseudarcicella hirudinis TaxID=1079859 RepID=UPI0035EFBE53
MLDIIQLLPDSIANQIAAGEVVQRPASVVKELLENSIDAQAKQIQLIVREAGKTLIQIIDDGIGMSETDARMCLKGMLLLRSVVQRIYLRSKPWAFVGKQWLLSLLLLRLR